MLRIEKERPDPQIRRLRKTTPAVADLRDPLVGALAREAATLEDDDPLVPLGTGRALATVAVIAGIAAVLLVTSEMPLGPKLAVALVGAGVVAAAGWLGRRRQLRIGRRAELLLAARSRVPDACPACFYDLTAAAGDRPRCPECGRPARHDPAPPPPIEARRRVEAHLARRARSGELAVLISLAPIVLLPPTFEMFWFGQGDRDLTEWLVTVAFTAVGVLVGLALRWVYVRARVARRLRAGAAARTCWHCGGDKPAATACPACDAAAG